MRLAIKMTPFISMWIVLLAGLGLAGMAVFTALQQPWHGITFRVDGQQVVVDRVLPPLDGIRAAQVVQAIAPATGQPRIVLDKQDMMEDPDQLETYQQSRQFFLRQQQLFQILKQDQLVISFADGSAVVLDRKPARPLASLPLAFWVQMLVGLSSFLIGGWVWGISRKRYTTFILFVAGCCIMAAAFAAAIYSTRVIALPAPLFELLSNLNHTGAMLFSIVLVLLFSNYPHKLLSTNLQGAFALLMFCWWLCDMFKVFFSGSPVGAFVPVLLGLVLMLLLAWLQYRKAKYDPVAQAALRWFGLSIALGAGIPILLMALPSLFGMNTAIPQGYAFLFFLLIYVGVVQGVARYKLFELEGWVFRILFYLVAACVLVLLDAVLILAASIDQAPAFGLSVLLLALFYLPLRDMLARRFSASRSVDREKMFQQIVNISLSPRSVNASESWQLFLRQVFDALHIEACVPDVDSPQQPEIQQEGVRLVVPVIGGLPAMNLGYASAGRRLFSIKDVALVTEICAMLRYALHAKHAYEQGVIQERSRIGRDLHDNIGAQLLTALHSKQQEYKDYMISETLTDLRHIINHAMSGGQALEELAIELRRETAERIEAAGLQLSWSFQDQHDMQVSGSQLHAIRSIMREAVSNTIRHAKATRLTVDIQTAQHEIRILISDNGTGLIGQQAGHGLHSMRQRLGAFKGCLAIQSNNSGLSLSIHMPCQAVAAS